MDIRQEFEKLPAIADKLSRVKWNESFNFYHTAVEGMHADDVRYVAGGWMAFKAAKMKDQSFFTMIAEHQELSARALRLHEVLNQHPCVRHMPTEACTLINEMKNIVDTGKAHPDGLETSALNFDSELPFTDPEINTVHDFQVGDTVWIPDVFARYKFIVSSHQRFEVTQIVGNDQLYVCHIHNPNIPFTNNQKCFTAHFSHFAKFEGETSCAV